MAHSSTGYTTNLKLTRRHRRQGVDRVGVRRQAAVARARGPGPVAGPAPVLLEVREVDQPPRADEPRTSRASGNATATTTAATPGSSSATRATRERHRDSRRRPGRQGESSPRSCRPRPWSGCACTSRRKRHWPGSALPDPVARPRRLHGPAVLLRRLRRQRPPRGVPRRETARRRGLGVPGRCRRGGRRPRAAWPDRPLVPVGHRDPCAVPGRRIRRRPCRGHDESGSTRRPPRTDPGGRGRPQPEELPYADELAKAGATIAYTRHETDIRAAGPPTVEELTPLLAGSELAYVCGSSRFAQFAEGLLLECGLSPEAIRVEQFGATG